MIPDTLPAGKYYFGDICYAMDEEVYRMIWGRKFEYQDGTHVVDFVDSKGKHWEGMFAVYGTAHGDGCYEGIHQDYGVDAGVLGLVPESLWGKKLNFRTSGTIFVSKSPVMFSVCNGKFSVDCDGFKERVDTKCQDEEQDEGQEDADQG